MIALWQSDTWAGVPVVWWAVGGLVLVLGVFGLLNGWLNRIYRPVDGLVQGVVGRMGSGKSLFIVQRVLLPFCAALARKGVVLSQSGRPMTRVVTNFAFNPEAALGRRARHRVEVRHVEPTSDDSIFAALIDLSHDIGRTEGPWFDDDAVMHSGRETPPADAIPHELRPGVWSYVRQPILNALVVLDELHLFANSSKLALGEEASFVISMARKLNAEVWWCSQHEMKVHKRIRDESSSIWLAGKLTGFAAAFVGSGWHLAREYHSPALVERARNSFGTAQAPRPSDKRVYRFTRRTSRFYNSFELLVPDPSGSAGARRSGAEATRSAGRMARLGLDPSADELVDT